MVPPEAFSCAWRDALLDHWWLVTVSWSNQVPDTAAAILEDLTGQERPFAADLEAAVMELLTGTGLGHSQLNELLLSYGYDRLSPAFFQYLIGSDGDGEREPEKPGKANAPDEQPSAVEISPPLAFHSLHGLRSAVDRFRQLAVLRFGSVKFGFKYLSKLDDGALAAELEVVEPIPVDVYTKRHNPLVPIDPIPGGETYYLGYIIHRELEKRLRENPGDDALKTQLEKRKEIVARGKKNHEAYLASDHMDVYVATSMREPHEYQVVARTITEVFDAKILRDLKIRWFDPTQAYCEDRIDKGLVEALMLRRAMCTLYLVQETDTLGKDSELASTLAQGKPVIAYVPEVKGEHEREYAESLLKMVGGGGTEVGIDVILRQLRIYAPETAWNDPDVQSWVRDPAHADVAAAKAMLARRIRDHYENRAKTLKDSHPLGLQVNLETGVANGVLVARTPEQCSMLICRVLTNTLTFKLTTEKGSLLLREELTGSVFRAVTGDKFLTNSFWNFYLTNVP
jgi:hypothetical protein